MEKHSQQERKTMKCKKIWLITKNLHQNCVSGSKIKHYARIVFWLKNTNTNTLR